MAGMPRAALGLVTVTAIALAIPPAAGAVTNSVAFSGKLAMASAPSATAPANTGFEWAHHITTSPAGNQPDTAESFKVLFPAPLILNAQDYPACNAATVDGHPSMSDDCTNAVVGAGTATMYAGSPGSPLSNSVREDLTVTAVNGTPAGSQLLLILNSTPSAPVAITNRAVAGKIAAADGYAFGAEFSVPADLQQQLGLSLSITDLDVTISGTGRPITVGATTKSMSYLQLPACDGALPARQLTNFRPTAAVTSDASIACAMGSFPDPPGYPTAPYTSPRVPAPPQSAAITRTGSTNLGRLKVRRNGTVRLPAVAASCPGRATGPCTVTGSATRGRVVVVALSTRVPAGTSAPLSVKLTKAGKRLLARSKRVPLTLALKATTPAGVVTTKTLKLTLVR